MPWLAGQGVGLIHEIMPAGTIVTNMMAEAARIIRKHAQGTSP
jgi:NAD(P)H-dependent flavin oxidoreductase YrpB (nitropropane dioxygenase family)